jgi:hypothetical protein
VLIGLGGTGWFFDTVGPLAFFQSFRAVCGNVSEAVGLDLLRGETQCSEDSTDIIV